MQRPSKAWIPIKAQGLINTVQAIIDDQRPTPFLNGRPGRKWYMGIMKGHPSLSLREAEGISKERAVITEEYIKKLFKEGFYPDRAKVFDILNDPSRIFEGDETSFSLCPKTEKLWAPK